MPGEPRSWPALLSRRSLLQGVASAAGAGTILCAAPNAATGAPKISQKAVAYQDHPEGDKRCDKCVQFQPPDGCKMVEGTINPQGSCRIFVPIRQSMKRSMTVAWLRQRYARCKTEVVFDPIAWNHAFVPSELLEDFHGPP